MRARLGGTGDKCWAHSVASTAECARHLSARAQWPAEQWQGSFAHKARGALSDLSGQPAAAWPPVPHSGSVECGTSGPSKLLSTKCHVNVPMTHATRPATLVITRDGTIHNTQYVIQHSKSWGTQYAIHNTQYVPVLKVAHPIHNTYTQYTIRNSTRGEVDFLFGGKI